METIIELEIGCEQPVFETILVNPEKILVLPKGYYEKFMDYIIQEEMYEHISKLESIKDKVSDKILDEMLEDSDLTEL
jgi:hypothetical protein